MNPHTFATDALRDLLREVGRLSMADLAAAQVRTGVTHERLLVPMARLVQAGDAEWRGDELVWVRGLSAVDRPQGGPASR